MEVTDLLAIPLMLIKSWWLLAWIIAGGLVVYHYLINPLVKKVTGAEETWEDRLHRTIHEETDAKHAAEAAAQDRHRQQLLANREARQKAVAEWRAATGKKKRWWEPY